MNHIAAIGRALEDRGLDGILILNEKDLRYAAGFPFTDGAVLVGREGAWLFTDSRYIEAAQVVLGSDAQVLLFDRDRPLLSLVARVAGEQGMERLAAQLGQISHRELKSWSKALGREPEDDGDLLSALRCQKDPQELSAMAQAQAIAEKSLGELLEKIEPGMTERQIMAELVYLSLLNGSEGNSFDPIVVSGPRGSLPHGVPGDRPVEKGDFITIDFGCIKEGYCSDMTRTFALGEPTEEMARVYQIVLEAQLRGIAAARAGATGRDVDKAAREVIEAAGYGDYFGHGFGHGLGLDIHEAPRLSPGGSEPLPVGAVCSAEPGIYLPGRFGVRIEDVMVIEEGGCRLLTSFPKELIVL